MPQLILNLLHQARLVTHRAGRVGIDPQLLPIPRSQGEGTKETALLGGATKLQEGQILLETWRIGGES